MDEVTILDDAPEEIKRQILANDRALKERDSRRSKSDTGRGGA